MHTPLTWGWGWGGGGILALKGQIDARRREKGGGGGGGGGERAQYKNDTRSGIKQTLKMCCRLR